MKDMRLSGMLIAAKSKKYELNHIFTDKVMDSLHPSAIFTKQIRSMNVNKKETFVMKLKHLPRMTAILLAFGALFLLTGTTYAVVKTVESLAQVKVNQTGTNTFGREELNVNLENCGGKTTDGTKYELTKGSGLSNDDAARTLQARCDVDAINNWILAHPQWSSSLPFLAYSSKADTISSINSDSITLKEGGVKKLTNDMVVVYDNNEVSKDTLKVGDSVIVFPDASSQLMTKTPLPLSIFVVSQPTKYYSHDYQSYVNERGHCPNNPTRECLLNGSRDYTALMVAHGGAYYGHVIQKPGNTKNVQGKVLSYDANEIKLDVGGGVVYTVHTQSNVIDTYNTITVYTLKSLDDIYAYTKPEDIKIYKGDSLDIAYDEDPSQSSSNILYSNLLGIQLVVEHVPNNTNTVQLRKY
ncbi:MAG: hypothetical protein ABIQ04_01075 [Candidatus Saccharimonadales bacterium]